MPNVCVHKPSGMLFFDFRFDGERSREYTALPDTPANRKKMEKILQRIASEIKAGTFDYEAYFPNSMVLERLRRTRKLKAVLAQISQLQTQLESSMRRNPVTPESQGPTFEAFAQQWIDEHSIEWRRSHIRSLLSTVKGRLVPYFGTEVVGGITKSDVLAYRATLAKEPGRGGKSGLSAKRINEIMGTLKQILGEAAARFKFTSPMANVKRLRVSKTDVHPVAGVGRGTGVDRTATGAYQHRDAVHQTTRRMPR